MRPGYGSRNLGKEEAMLVTFYGVRGNPDQWESDISLRIFPEEDVITGHDVICHGPNYRPSTFVLEVDGQIVFSGTWKCPEVYMNLQPEKGLEGVLRSAILMAAAGLSAQLLLLPVFQGKEGERLDFFGESGGMSVTTISFSCSEAVFSTAELLASALWQR